MRKKIETRGAHREIVYYPKTTTITVSDTWEGLPRIPVLGMRLHPTARSETPADLFDIDEFQEECSGSEM